MCLQGGVEPGGGALQLHADWQLPGNRRPEPLCPGKGKGVGYNLCNRISLGVYAIWTCFSGYFKALHWFVAGVVVLFLLLLLVLCLVLFLFLFLFLFFFFFFFSLCVPCVAG